MLSGKGPDAFRTISEAAEEVGAPAHVLRFWESRFACIKPMRRAGGRRFYRPADVALLAALRQLLHDDGYAIKDLERLSARGILERARRSGAALSADVSPSAHDDRIAGLKSALARAILAKSRLDSLLAQSGR